MKNMLLYFYHIYPENIILKGNKYFIKYQGNNYVFMLFDRPESDVLALYNLNIEMKNKNILVHEIIKNSEGNILTYVENKPYILLETFISLDSRVKIEDICNINNRTININCSENLIRYDWINLWEAKNDYYESQINEIGTKFPNLSMYINYYIGLSENAISYVKDALKLEGNAYYSASHKRINYNSTLLELYNPTYYVYDYRIRDACEYIKNAFFNEKDALYLVNIFFKNNYLTYKEAVLFYGRLLYPSYFFDLQDEIVNNNLDESKIEKFILKSKDYEIFLKNVYNYISKFYNKYIPVVDWLI